MQGNSPGMTRAIAIGALTAVRAVLIYGEWSDLSTRPVRLPRRRWRRTRTREPVLAPQHDALIY